MDKLEAFKIIAPVIQASIDRMRKEVENPETTTDAAEVLLKTIREQEATLVLLNPDVVYFGIGPFTADTQKSTVIEPGADNSTEPPQHNSGFCAVSN